MYFTSFMRFKGLIQSQKWWLTLVISAYRRLRQENHGFKVSVRYVVRLCLQKPNK
jgi:hypothetical protein